ncbi:MAG: hypothetical protein AAFS12_10075 [Cyanobacteria bacterium J06632_19]
MGFPIAEAALLLVNCVTLSSQQAEHRVRHSLPTGFYAKLPGVGAIQLNPAYQ